MLTLVTVCFNNPEELEKTVASVLLQTVQPDDYVIVDSSDSDTGPGMKRIADNANARYVWVPPEGVYQAMRHSLTLVDDESWVWWINSSDWLAGIKSIEIVTEAISDVDSNLPPSWSSSPADTLLSRGFMLTPLEQISYCLSRGF